MNRLAAVLLFASIWTAAAEPPTDEANLVRFPAGPASWTIKCTRLAGEGDAARSAETELQIDSIKVEQEGRKVRQIVTYSNGKSYETWGIAGLPEVATEDAGGTVYFTRDAAPFDRSEFGWVTAENQVEKEPVKYLGRTCLHYRAEKLVTGEGGYQGTVKLEAWIDPETRFPIACQDNLERRIFTFVEFTGPLTIPERFVRPLEAKRRMLGIKQPIQ